MTGSGMYTTQLQAGLGLVPETRALLDLWEPGMDRVELYKAALESGGFPNVSARRLRNIVGECFAPRLLNGDAKTAQFLKQLRTAMSTGEFNQLLFIHTCRANPILGDFVRTVYWDRYEAGSNVVTNDDAREFIGRAVDDGMTITHWSDSTVKRVSSYLIGACADFGLLGKRSGKGRQIVPFRIAEKVAAYLAHDLHFSGLGDNAVVAHKDWQLFGLDTADVRDQMRKLSLQGYLIFQSAAEVTHISWKHKSMEDFVDVLAQG